MRLAAAEKFVDADSLIRRLEGLAAGGTPAGAGGGRPSGVGGGGRPPAGRPYQKKKTVAPAAPVARTATPPQPQPKRTPLENPRWELAYLRSHWDGVAEALAETPQARVSGLLRPAKVLGLDGDALKLGYDQAHESLREQARRQDGQVTAALGKLFGREVRCEYVPTGDAGEPLRNNSNHEGSVVLSSAERAAVAADPAVKAVLDFFDGSVTDIRRPAAAAGEPAEDDEE